MSVFQYRSGLGNSAAYQVSAIPYATSSLEVATTTVTKVQFPNVTNFITVKNEDGGELRFGFSEAGVSGSGTNYIKLETPGESYTANFRLSEIFLIASGSAVTASVVAGLTTISTNELPNNWSGSAGVG